MNQNWKNFLNSVKASFEYNDVIAFPTRSNHYEKLIYPITQLAVLTVSGKDAAKLLLEKLAEDLGIELNIPWNIENPVLSAKDIGLPTFSEFVSPF